jgi:hypothetical protein
VSPCFGFFFRICSAALRPVVAVSEGANNGCEMTHPSCIACPHSCGQLCEREHSLSSSVVAASYFPLLGAEEVAARSSMCRSYLRPIRGYRSPHYFGAQTSVADSLALQLLKLQLDGSSQTPRVVSKIHTKPKVESLDLMAFCTAIPCKPCVIVRGISVSRLCID